MPLHLIHGDITTLEVDAIVNAANSSLLGGGGVDGAIHRAAGPELLAECRTLGGCPTGQARITGAYRLPCRWVIHTVGPVWQGGSRGEEALLRSCYEESLALAGEKGCGSVAFPIISGGVYGYPFRQAVAVAEAAITAWEGIGDTDVYLVFFGSVPSLSEEYPPRKDRFSFALRKEKQSLRPLRAAGAAQKESAPMGAAPEMFAAPMAVNAALREEAAICQDSALPEELGTELENLDESFSQMLLRLIDQRGMTDVECYKRANVSRKLFSKIRSDPAYRPSKPTVLAFAIALRLTLPQTETLLRTAGFALSRSTKGDVIVEYFLRRGVYDIFTINNALFDCDQTLLGAS